MTDGAKGDNLSLVATGEAIQSTKCTHWIASLQAPRNDEILTKRHWAKIYELLLANT